MTSAAGRFDDTDDEEEEGYLRANDGLLARRSGQWAKEKLAWLERFAAPALSVTHNFSQRVFVDLFAGPGRNRTRAGDEFDGSPIIALRSQGKSAKAPRFTRAHFVNLDPIAHDALQLRVAAKRAAGDIEIPESQIAFHQADANEEVTSILGNIPPRSAYTLVMADITRISHFPFSTVEAIAGMKHRALDFYVLLPIEMGIIRQMSWNPATLNQSVPALNAFFGTGRWRPLYDARQSEAQAPAFKQGLIDLYLDQLRKHWPYAGVMAAPGRTESAKLYRMLFATRNETAYKIALGSKPKAPKGQIELF